MWGKRTAALVLCLMMAVLTLPSAALAAGVDLSFSFDQNPIVEKSDNPGKVIVKMSITSAASSAIEVLQVVPKYITNGIIVSHQTATLTPNGNLAGTGDIITASLEVTLNDALSSGQQYNAQFDVYYTITVGSITETRKVTTDAVKIYKTSPSTATTTPEPEETAAPTDSTIALMLSSADADGQIVPAPKGNAGDTIHIRLPILNRSRSKVSKILVTPQLSATLDSFPFVIEAVDYTCKAPDLRAGELAEVDYTFKLSSKVTSGVKEVKFNAVYFNYAKDAYETATFSVFVTVVKGASATLTDEDGVAITSTPKVIVESYSVKPAKLEDQESGRLFAGEQFELSFTIRNTSSKEAVQNIQVTISNEGGAILPANNGSNSLYIDRIAAGDSVEKTLKMQSSPDAEDKAHTLSVKFGYESSETLKTYEATETITLPISQRMRVRVGDPVIYGDAMIEQSTPVNFSLYNMGKATLYNCMVDVEGGGLRMEESYYGGNISSGNEMRADFNIIPSTAGQIEGKVVITYEDVYGQQTRVEKPFTLNVQEAFMPGPEDGKDVFGPGFEEELKPKMPTWIFVAGGVILAGGVVTLLTALRRKRRKRELEDV
jgi:hypothetical protein